MQTKLFDRRRGRDHTTKSHFLTVTSLKKKKSQGNVWFNIHLLGWPCWCCRRCLSWVATSSWCGSRGLRRVATRCRSQGWGLSGVTARCWGLCWVAAWCSRWGLRWVAAGSGLPRIASCWRSSGSRGLCGVTTGCSRCSRVWAGRWGCGEKQKQKNTTSLCWKDTCKR